MFFEWREIRTEKELDDVLNGTTVPSNKFPLLFKHSKRCVLSSMAKNRLERNPDDRLEYFLIDVIDRREVSNALAVRSGIRHESPQAFLYNHGVLLSAESHMAIDSTEVSARLDSLERA